MKRTDRLAHVQAWRGSGLTRPHYCRRHGLKYGTFMSWFKLESQPREVGNFVALASASEIAGQVEIIFPNGIRVQYSGSLDSELIRQLQDA